MKTVDSEKLAVGSGDLPKGWCISTISEIINKTGVFVDGDWIESKDQDQNGNIRLLQLADIGDGSFIDKSCRFINEEVFSRLKCTEIFPGDILVARMPYPLGRACILPFVDYRAITVVDVCIIRPNKLYIDATWLMSFINSNDFRNKIESLSSGTTRKRISRLNLSTIPLPLPPSNEQKRIVAKLDAIMPRIEAVKARLDKVPGILKRFHQSVLTAAVTGKLTEQWRAEHPEVGEWEEILSRELFSFVTSGSRGWAKYYSDEGALFLRIGNLDHDKIEIDMSKMQFVSLPKNTEGVRTKVQANDILISITADVGMIALVPENFCEAYINQHISLARPNSLADPTYLAWFLTSREGQTQFISLQKGATKVGLGLDDIKNVNVSLPPLEEQKEIVRQVDKLFALANKVEAHYQKAKARVDKLSQSVLAKAFRGELVPQDPNDEPAEKLLERILAEKAKMESELKGARKRGSKK